MKRLLLMMACLGWIAGTAGGAPFTIERDGDRIYAVAPHLDSLWLETIAGCPLPSPLKVSQFQCDGTGVCRSVDLWSFLATGSSRLSSGREKLEVANDRPISLSEPRFVTENGKRLVEIDYTMPRAAGSFRWRVETAAGAIVDSGNTLAVWVSRQPSSTVKIHLASASSAGGTFVFEASIPVGPYGSVGGCLTPDWVTKRATVPSQEAQSGLELSLDLDTGAYPNGVKMLVAKYRADDAFPNAAQLQPDVNGRPRMRITGRVRDLVTGAPPAAATRVYLRLRDPADTAPYAVGAGHAKTGDNKDLGVRLSTTDGTRSVISWDCAGSGCGTPQALAVDVPAGSGQFEAILVGTYRYAGDNYRVEASLRQDMTCPTPGACASTATITAWKRVYVEINKMARKGAQLTRPLAPGDTLIRVEDVRHFPTKVPFQILLLHAPPADSLGGNFYTEEHTVEKVEGKKLFSFFKPEPGTLILKQGETVRQVFLGPESITDHRSQVTLDRGYLADAVMWLRNDRAVDYFTPDLSRVAALFEDAFVETVWLTDDAAADGAPPGAVTLSHDGYMPYFDEIPGHNERDWLARKWMRNATRSGSARSAESNHQILFAAWYMEGIMGAVKVADGFNDGWLFAKNYIKAHPGKVLAHELAHEWRTNQGYSPVTGTTPQPGSGIHHCDDVFMSQPTVPAYTGNEDCVMNSDIGIIPDGEKSSVAFHYIVAPGGAVDSEYIWIRERMEPVPQNDANDRNRYFR